MEYLLSITFEEALLHRTCVKCNSIGRVERHHVIYNPAKIARLCRRCHHRITKLNAKIAWKKKKRLSNQTRLTIWKRFLQND